MIVSATDQHTRSAATASGRTVSAIIQLFSSVKFGVLLLALVLLYASIFSALPQVRGALELTEMEAFRHPLFVTLLALFYVCLGVTTWRRIRWNVLNLGVLTVHAGLFLLGGGALYYFGTKVEGDLLLRSPRIELVQIAGADSKVLTSFLAEKGQTWATEAPILGGRLAIEVAQAGPAGLQPVGDVELNVALGADAPRQLTLSAGEMKALTERLALRLTTFSPVDTFYDDELASLAIRRLDQPEATRTFTSIAGLPLHRERYLDEGYALVDRAGRSAPSKRVTPGMTLAGVTIPTGWFEHWRMPIALDLPAAPFDATVTGYLPYVGDLRPIARGGGPTHYPGLNYTLEIAGQRIDESLFADDPARSLSARVRLEFRWVADEAQRAALRRPMIAAHELEVETLSPPTRRTLAIAQDQVLRIEGTSYELKIAELSPSWPLMTPGYENAESPAAQVEVKSAEKSFKRTVIERFPQLSQDIDEQGVRRSEGPYDPNLRLTYRSAGKLMIVAGPGAAPELIVIDADGKSNRAELQVGGPATPFTIFGVGATLRVSELFETARVDAQPVVEPIEARRPGLGRQPSAIRLRLTGKGTHSSWSDSRWVMFSSFPEDQPSVAIVRGPDGVDWELLYTRAPVKLGATLAARALRVNFFPGRRSANTWRSDFLAQQQQGSLEAVHVETNVTANVAGWTLFQSGAAQDHWSFTILGVGNRNGLVTMTVGCSMIALGCLYAFYVKPALKKRQAAAALALRSAPRGERVEMAGAR